MIVYEYIIPSWAICYLINGDASALEDEEIEKVDQFVNDQLELENIECFNVTPPDGESYFNYRNDIDGTLGADVYDCQVIVRNKSE
jgi:hypothetical protein